MGDKSGVEKHVHRCPCGAEFDCVCPDPQSNGIDAYSNGWRYQCPNCDPFKYASDPQ